VQNASSCLARAVRPSRTGQETVEKSNSRPLKAAARAMSSLLAVPVARSTPWMLRSVSAAIRGSAELTGMRARTGASRCGRGRTGIGGAAGCATTGGLGPSLRSGRTTT
jgi:hypothetical protein